jgi:hypothetical protein
MEKWGTGKADGLFSFVLFCCPNGMSRTHSLLGNLKLHSQSLIMTGFLTTFLSMIRCGVPPVQYSDPQVTSNTICTSKILF